jgi:hypothetical protein
MECMKTRHKKIEAIKQYISMTPESKYRRARINVFPDMLSPFEIFIYKESYSKKYSYTHQQEAQFFIPLLQGSN